MEIDTPAGPSTFRPTPALGVTYLLDVDEEDVKIIPVVPLPPIDDPNDEDYDPRADQDIDDADEEDDDDPEELGPPYPTPSSIVRGKRKATEIYVVDDEEDADLRQYDRLRRKKARLGRSRQEPEYILISSDSEEDGDDIMKIPRPEPERKVKREDTPPKLPLSASKDESEQDDEPPDESSASSDPEADMGSVERIRPNAPNWLEVQLAKSRKQCPRASIELIYYYSIEGDIWQVKCNTCHKTCSIGPGESLSYFNKHLSGRSHQAAVGNFYPMPMPIPSAAGARAAAARSSNNDNEARTAAAAGTSRRDPPQGRDPAGGASDGRGHRRRFGHGREKAGAARQNGVGGGGGADGDDVERFLDQLGLSVDLAPKLRSFGFEDDRQMSLMGRLSDESLGLLLEHLTKQGVSLVTAIIVREGLKRRAGTL